MNSDRENDDREQPCPSAGCDCPGCSVTCATCSDPLGEWLGDVEAYQVNGAWYCRVCFYQKPAIAQALQAVGERGDYE